MTIIEQVRETFKNVEVGEMFHTSEIKQMVYSKFGRNMGSVIPSDYCYNKTNKGKVGKLVSFNLFVQVKRGLYKYVGEGYKE